jgi:chemotaxis signal transduction protein
MLVLRARQRWLAIAASAVAEIVLKGDITSVPPGPHHVVGVTLVRGRLVAVIAIDEMLDLAAAAETVATLPRLVVVRGADTDVAIVADEIRGIVELELPAYGEDGGPRPSRISFVAGELQLADQLLSVLDAERFVDAAIAGERAR